MMEKDVEAKKKRLSHRMSARRFFWSQFPEFTVLQQTLSRRRSVSVQNAARSIMSKEQP